MVAWWLIGRVADARWLFGGCLVAVWWQLCGCLVAARWHMRKLKKERTAMRQLQAQALHHRRHGANRTHDQWVPTWKMVADALTKMMDTSVLRAAVGAGVALFQAVPKQSGTVRCGSGTKSVLLAAIGASRLGGVLGSDALAAANTVVQIPWQDCTSSLLFAAFLGFVAGTVLSCCLGLVALVWLWRQPSTPQQRDGGSREEYSRRESEPVRFSGRSVTSRDVGVQSPMSYARNRQQPRFVPSTGDAVSVGETRSSLS